MGGGGFNGVQAMKTNLTNAKINVSYHYHNRLWTTMVMTL